LQALRDVVEAQGGMSRTARLAGLNRESLYGSFSRRGNPSLTSLKAVLTTLGLKLQFRGAADDGRLPRFGDNGCRGTERTTSLPV